MPFGFRKWFNDKFGDLCEEHDWHYERRIDRRRADCILAGKIIQCGYPGLGVVTYIFVRLIGWRHYPK
jgi:hypothetical protein